MRVLYHAGFSSPMCFGIHEAANECFMNGSPVYVQPRELDAITSDATEQDGTYQLNLPGICIISWLV